MWAVKKTIPGPTAEANENVFPEGFDAADSGHDFEPGVSPAGRICYTTRINLATGIQISPLTHEVSRIRMRHPGTPRAGAGLYSGDVPSTSAKALWLWILSKFSTWR